MKDFKTIDPETARRSGYRSFVSERRSQTKNVRGLNADAERYASAKGWRIVGKWDDPEAPHHRRTYWCIG